MPPDHALRILHLSAPGTTGGLESVVRDLTVGLRSAGQEVVLAAVLDAGVPDPPLLAQVETRGVSVRRIPLPGRAYLREYREVRSLIRELRPDVVHTHGYRTDLIGGRAARAEGVPWVTTVHGFTGGDRKNQLYEWLQVRSYRRASRVIAVSQPLREQLLRRGVPAERTVLLPNGFAPAPPLTRDEARVRLKLDGSAPVIGWVGRLSAEKGPDLLLLALARLQGPRWEASIVGDGPNRAALDAQARDLGIADRIHWHGTVPDAAALYPAFDAWVLSSRTEGTPIALFEAMSAGIPIVATSVGGVPHVVSTEEALLVPPGRPEELAGAIDEALLGGAAVLARAEAARRRLSDVFGAEAWVDAHLGLYRAL